MKASVYLSAALLVTASASLHAQDRAAPKGATQEEVLRVPAGSVRRPPATMGLGLRVRPQPLATGGFRWADYPLVHEVYAGSPAARLGIRSGDQVLSANGVDAREPSATRITHVGQRFALRIRRGSQVRDYTIVTVPNPPAR
ncbi:MAG TPA: PDZ domain-containing protein [Longimicrobium sp.]|jgi:S1-C subfamily serine protease